MAGAVPKLFSKRVGALRGKLNFLGNFGHQWETVRVREKKVVHHKILEDL